MTEKDADDLDPYVRLVIDRVYQGERFDHVLRDVSTKNRVNIDKLELFVLLQAQSALSHNLLLWKFQPLLDQIATTNEGPA